MNTRVTEVTALLGLVLMFSLAATDPLDEYLRYEAFVEAVKAGQVVSVALDEFSRIDGVYTAGGAEQAFHTYHADPRDDPVEIHDKSITVLNEKPVWPEGLTPIPAEQAADYVVENAAARPWDRDAIDRRIIQTFIERTGRIIDSQEEVGGYPTHEPVRRALDVPESNRREWLSTIRRPV